jgi:hypothetical protein
VGPPVVVEIPESGRDVEGIHGDVGKAYTAKEGLQRFGLADGKLPGLIQGRRLRVERDRGLPKGAHQLHLARVVPDVGRDCSGGSGGARHLRNG